MSFRSRIHTHRATQIHSAGTQYLDVIQAEEHFMHKKGFAKRNESPTDTHHSSRPNASPTTDIPCALERQESLFIQRLSRWHFPHHPPKATNHWAYGPSSPQTKVNCRVEIMFKSVARQVRFRSSSAACLETPQTAQSHDGDCSRARWISPGAGAAHVGRRYFGLSPHCNACSA